MMAERLDPLVRATAWKESCWRHLVRSSDGPQVLRSAGGAVGMMQINGRVWRNVYDLDRLVDEVDYNVNAGIDILTHYMIDYAMRKGEHEQPGGEDNLVKATYAAYNGGPGHLSRYRREDTAARLNNGLISQAATQSVVNEQIASIVVNKLQSVTANLI